MWTILQFIGPKIVGNSANLFKQRFKCKYKTHQSEKRRSESHLDIGLSVELLGFLFSGRVYARGDFRQSNR